VVLNQKQMVNTSNTEAEVRVALWHGIMVSGIWHMDEVTLCQARLVARLVTVFRWVYHLGT